MLFDLTFIGIGPSILTTVFTLLKKGYKGSICLIDKGGSAFTRNSAIDDTVLSGSVIKAGLTDYRFSQHFA